MHLTDAYFITVSRRLSSLIRDMLNVLVVFFACPDCNFSWRNIISKHADLKICCQVGQHESVQKADTEMVRGWVGVKVGDQGEDRQGTEFTPSLGLEPATVWSLWQQFFCLSPYLAKNLHMYTHTHIDTHTHTLAHRHRHRHTYTQSLTFHQVHALGSHPVPPPEVTHAGVCDDHPPDSHLPVSWPGAPCAERGSPEQCRLCEAVWTRGGECDHRSL